MRWLASPQCATAPAGLLPIVGLAGLVDWEIGSPRPIARGVRSLALPLANFAFQRASSFPTQYAQNSASEDFAEIFAAWVLRGFRGKLYGFQMRLDADIMERFRSTIAMDPQAKQAGIKLREALQQTVCSDNDFTQKLTEATLKRMSRTRRV